MGEKLPMFANIPRANPLLPRVLCSRIRAPLAHLRGPQREGPPSRGEVLPPPVAESSQGNGTVGYLGPPAREARGGLKAVLSINQAPVWVVQEGHGQEVGF